MIRQVFTAENFTSRVGAEFETNEEACRAAQELQDRAPGGPLSVQVIDPYDRDVDRKLEPEAGRLPATMVRSHLVAGSAGLGLGMLLACIQVAADVHPLASSPVWAVAMFSALGLVLGLLTGGLVGCRPDHDPLVFAAKKALRSGRSYVVVHTDDADIQREAQQVFRRYGQGRRRTL
jgi:hypothetical protein